MIKFDGLSEYTKLVEIIPIHERLNEIMKSKNISIVHLAELLKIDSRTIRGYLKGEIIDKYWKETKTKKYIDKDKKIMYYEYHRTHSSKDSSVYKKLQNIADALNVDVTQLIEDYDVVTRGIHKRNELATLYPDYFGEYLIDLEDMYEMIYEQEDKEKADNLLVIKDEFFQMKLETAYKFKTYYKDFFSLDHKIWTLLDCYFQIDDPKKINLLRIINNLKMDIHSLLITMQNKSFLSIISLKNNKPEEIKKEMDDNILDTFKLKKRKYSDEDIAKFRESWWNTIEKNISSYQHNDIEILSKNIIKISFLNNEAWDLILTYYLLNRGNNLSDEQVIYLDLTSFYSEANNSNINKLD